MAYKIHGKNPCYKSMSEKKNIRPWWRLICPAASARAAARTMPRCPSRGPSAAPAAPRLDAWDAWSEAKRGQKRPSSPREKGVKNGSWAKFSSKILELNYDWTMEKWGHHETWGVSHEFHEKWTMKNRGFDHVDQQHKGVDQTAGGITGGLLRHLCSDFAASWRWKTRKCQSLQPMTPGVQKKMTRVVPECVFDDAFHIISSFPTVPSIYGGALYMIIILE